VPEVYEAPDFVDTDSFPARHGTSVGGEIAYAEGPVMVSSEYTSTWVSSAETGNPRFDGYYVTASWFITGESRPYDRTTGSFGAIAPAAPFSFRHGGIGAWELAARYSHIDLTSGTLDGGEFDRWSGAISWRPTVRWRLEFNYGHGRLEKAGLVGFTNFYQLRLQFQL
jgi:phosphate-selective porin OprO/OprP